jgi:hypothetical protein
VVADAPLSRLVLTASSVVEDLGYVALADLSRAVASDPEATHRVIGGHMVTGHVARWQLGAELYRETADTDIGVPPVVVRDHHLLDRLRDLGYDQVEGNRFARTMADIPVRVLRGSNVPPSAILDVLVPAYTSRARQNHRISDNLVTTEVLGLATALQRPPVVMSLELRRLNGDALTADLCFPDEGAALALKGFSTQVRNKTTDVVDVWRCLEVALAAGIQPSDFADDTAADAAAIIRTLFDRHDGVGTAALIDEQRLSPEAADQRFTRLRALITRVIGTG